MPIMDKREGKYVSRAKDLNKLVLKGFEKETFTWRRLRIIISLCLLLSVSATRLPSPELPHEPMCDYLFNSWENEKALGAEGLFFKIGEKEGLIFVMDVEVGLHELGHFVWDTEKDKAAFRDAVNEYLANPDPKDPELQRRFAFWLEIGLDINDIYAELFKISLIGELPDVFEQFFDDKSENEE